MQRQATEAHRSEQLHGLWRHPISSIQSRLGALESGARGRIRRALSTGNEKLMELDGALARVASDDWSVPGVRKHLEELRARAEGLRDAAVRRVSEMPAEAVSRIATGTRAPIQNLARGLAGMAKRFEEAPAGGDGAPAPNPDRAA